MHVGQSLLINATNTAVLGILQIQLAQKTGNSSFAPEKNLASSGQECPIFEFSGSALRLTNSDMFLGIDESNRLTLQNTKHIGFGLKENPVSNISDILSLENDQGFQLCEDHSIGFRSNCEEASEVTIFFKKLSKA